ncbi:MAG TPA: sugar phosphate isomerase/epimerase family protein [Acidobacteriaceae bacterium]|nr:sugar phosphate isomerase/epimerase family protein [Acidobacteriaceae bacterium]
MMKAWMQGFAALAALLACLVFVALGQSGHRVRVGYCGPLKDIDAVKAAGFDYMEVRVSEVAALSDTEFEQVAAKFRQVGLPVLSANLFIPADIKVTGPAIDKERQMEYVRRALDRVSRLGVTLVVFGSGGARRVPEGFSHDEAFQQLVDFGKRIAPVARAHNITIAIEPLRRQETNIVNNTTEALAWVNAVNDPNIQLMIDFYHFSVEKEDPSNILKVKDHLRHLHMANPNGRVMPLHWDEYNYAPFFAVLRQIHYDRLISLEASTKDLPVEGPQSIALLRHAFGQ